MWKPINPARTKKLVIRTTALLLLVAGVVGVNYLSTMYHTRWDATAEQAFTLSDDTRRVLDRIDNPTVIHFFPLPSHVKRGPNTRRNRQAIQDLLREYVARSDQLSLQILPPAQFPERVHAIADQLKNVKKTSLLQREPVLIRQPGTGEYRLLPFERLRPIRPSSSGKNGKRHTVSFRWGEQAITSALYSLTRSRRITICIAGGQNNGATDNSSPDRSFTTVRQVLAEREGFHIRTLSQPIKQIPSTCDTLLIPPGASSFSGEERTKLRSFLENGGSVIALTEPEDVNGLRTLYNEYGIDLPDVALQPSADHTGPLSSFERMSWYQSHPITDPLRDTEASVFMRNWRVVTTTETTDERTNGTILLGSKRSRNDLRQADDNRSQYLVSGKRGSALPVAVASHRTQEGESETSSKLVVFGDSDWVSDRVLSRLQVVKGSGNLATFLNSVRWAAGIDDELRIIPEPSTNPTIVVTEGQAGAIFTLVVLLIPGCAFLLALTIWWFRRMRY